MSIFTIGDLHLSFSCQKPMDIFSGWENYVQKLEENWNSIVKKQDTVIIVGDISWANGMDEAFEDFKFINNLNGKKIILKGNHDYYWTTMKKMKEFFEEKNFNTLNILHNNSYEQSYYNICGTRGWMIENESDFNKKIISRETSRLITSLESAKNNNLEKIVFFHYPPIFNHNEIKEFTDVLKQYNIKRCYYGHVHGKSQKFAPNGTFDGIHYQLVSCDYTEFKPIAIG